MSAETEQHEDKAEKGLSNQLLGQVGLPAFIITTFFPQLLQKLSKYPKLIRALSLPLALWVGYEFLASKLTSLWYNLMSTGMSSVTVSADDTNLHATFRRFLSTQKLMMVERNMAATSIQHLHNSSDGYIYERQLGNGKAVIFDARNNYQTFWYKRRFYLVTVERTTSSVRRLLGAADLTVWTFGWSTAPIKEMLFEAHESAIREDQKVLTKIYVPDHGRAWEKRVVKNRRPLHSVYLPEGHKQMLVKDIGEYLDKETVKWYEDRGIPHRRGYLFHGRPGCGKTTLALALAGHFKLNVLMLSLMDEDVSDSSLLTLFQSLRAGTLMLLEDVDCAGIERRSRAKAKPSTKTKTGGDKGSQVTLSGLLNAIDGAGAPEGGILIMTTNKPDSLDEALVRAGRVDVRVEFRKACRSQVHDIFCNMYLPITTSKPQTDSSPSDTQPSDNKAGPIRMLNVEKARFEAARYREEVDRLAATFADNVPEDRFSPAELQEYILGFKNQPQAAVQGVAEWVAGQLEEQTTVEKVESSNSSDCTEDEQVFSAEQTRPSTPATSDSDVSQGGIAEPDAKGTKASRKTKASRSAVDDEEKVAKLAQWAKKLPEVRKQELIKELVSQSELDQAKSSS